MLESIKVVDSWAMVAWLQDEPAGSMVEAFLQEADSGNIKLVMSWMNVAETFYILHCPRPKTPTSSPATTKSGDAP